MAVLGILRLTVYQLNWSPGRKLLSLVCMCVYVWVGHFSEHRRHVHVLMVMVVHRHIRQRRL